MAIEYTDEQENYKLTITADSVTSTDKSFSIDDLAAGDNYEPLDVYLKKASGEEIRRSRAWRERVISNKTMPRLALQLFGKKIAKLPEKDIENFPICTSKQNKEMSRGIFPNQETFKKKNTGNKRLDYTDDNGRLFVVPYNHVFSTIPFVQECLHRFGEPGDQFILVYEKVERRNEKATMKVAAEPQDEGGQSFTKYRNPLSSKLVESKNLILRGAPGTGKTYLAKAIAADIISDGHTDDITQLSDEQKTRLEFVQFHPNYDYTDFVEGLRPKLSDDGSMGFVLQDGIFKQFVARARKDYEEPPKSIETVGKVQREGLKKYVFIIDEINRGEISKIFGELFFAIDPGYRGKAGAISTQYANLHDNAEEKFYIPDNLYIIGTMNDIDRSVDSFDFAMRRRFRFIELKASECLGMLNSLQDDKKRKEAIQRITALNNKIIEVEDLNSNYQIGASYFLKLETLDFDQLWTDYLQPLLQEYVQGMHDEAELMACFETAYGYKAPAQGDTHEPAQAQG